MLLPFLSHKPELHEDVFVAPDAVIIGNVVIGEASSIWYQTVIRGDVHHIRIGSSTNIQDGSVVHVTTGTYSVSIGDRVTIGHRAVIHGCNIGNDVLIGIGAIVLDGVEVGDGSLVAAGSLLPPNKIYPPNSFIMGIPGAVKRQVTDAERKGIRSAADHYVEIAREHSSLCPLDVHTASVPK